MCYSCATFCLFFFFVSARGSCKSYTPSRALPPYHALQLLSGHNVNSRVIHRLSTGIIVHPNLSLISVLPYYIRVQLRIIRVCSEVRGVVGAYSVTLSCPTINSQNLCTMLVQQSNYHATSNWQALISGPRMDKRPWPWGWYGKINIGDSAQCEISRACLARKLLRVRACIMLDRRANASIGYHYRFCLLYRKHFLYRLLTGHYNRLQQQGLTQ